MNKETRKKINKIKREMFVEKLFGIKKFKDLTTAESPREILLSLEAYKNDGLINEDEQSRIFREIAQQQAMAHDAILKEFRR